MARIEKSKQKNNKKEVYDIWNLSQDVNKPIKLCLNRIIRL
jgi:hypothetical protein